MNQQICSDCGRMRIFPSELWQDLHKKYHCRPGEGCKKSKPAEPIEKELKEQMELSCECGRDITYDLVSDLVTHEVYLSGVCDNEKCEKEFVINPTGWERE